MIEKESGELTFLRYALPVIGYCSQTPVPTSEISEFERMLKSEGKPSRKRLKEIFPNAVQHLEGWSPENIRAYWLGKHNKIVADNKFCRVYIAEVQKVLLPQGNEVCRVRVSRNRRKNPIEAKSYIPLNVGDRVSIHGFQVAEKLSPEDIGNYFRE